MSDSNEKAALIRIERTVRFWKRLYRTWWAVHYGVGIIGIAAAACAGFGAQDSHLLHSTAWIFGVAAAICTSLVTFLGPVEKAQRYWRAFHMVEQAMLEHEAGEIKLAAVANEMKSARHIVLMGFENQQQSAVENGNHEPANPAP